MRRYYWVAKAVAQLRQILLLNIAARLQPQAATPIVINERFFEKAGMIEVARDDLYLREPHAILETFLLYQQTPGVKGLVGAHAARALQRAPRDGRALPQRSGQPRDLHAHPAPAARHHARASG